MNKLTMTTVRRCWLFVRIVWREWEPGFRLSWRLSWQVAGCIHHAEGGE